MLTTLLIAFGLAMDAVAVSLSSALNLKDLRITHALRMATVFGLAQAIMPVIGWFAGCGAGDLIAGFDHWVAFVLLVSIGGHMIWGAYKQEDTDIAFDPLHALRLLLLAMATSIDALAAGLGLSFLRTPILQTAFLIRSITFVLSLLGVIAGDRIGRHWEDKAELTGGVILIAIGVKILVQHSL